MERTGTDYGVFCGVDVGKASNYMVALGPEGEGRILNRPVDQDEAEIRRALKEASRCGKVLVTVDQYGCIGRLVVAVARDMGFDVAHITPKDFNRIAETYSESKTDALDAYIIADVSRSTPRLVRLLGAHDELLDGLRVLASSRGAIVKERTSCFNRLHDLLQQVCPPLEALFAKDRLHSELALRLLERYGGPYGLTCAGKARVSKWAGSLKGHKARGPKLAGKVFSALSLMKVRLPSTALLEVRIKKAASLALSLSAEIKELDFMIKERSSLIPEVAILKSMPGIGEAYAAVIVGEVGDIGRFHGPDQLASYGGVAPAEKQSGTSVSRGKKAKGGNRRLKNALMRSSQLACRRDQGCAAYYERKRAEGKKHKQALRSLARRRVDVIYALMTTGSFYEPLR